jgi:hypothetical protein
LEEFVRMPPMEYLKAYAQLRHYSSMSVLAKTEMVEGKFAPGDFDSQKIHQPRALLS